MYSVFINGGYNGQFDNVAEAMAVVDKYARPYRASWKILDSYNRIYAQG